jgi:Helix-turn-helix domain
MTKDDDLDLVRGSGNVFRDFGYANAEVLSAKSKLAAEIICALGDADMSHDFLGAHPGLQAEELTRIRSASLSDVSLERLIEIVTELGRSVEIDLSFAETSSLAAAQ